MAAGFISDEEIQKVREANDIVAVISERTPVRQRGRDFWCCCPLHNEKTPSFKVDPVLQLWHCFGCGEGGDVFGFVMRTDDLTFPEAVRKLADRVHITLTDSSGRPGIASSYKARLKAVCAETADFYHTQLMRGKTAEAAQARTYLAGRGFGGETPKAWNLGFAPGRGALVRHLSAKGFKPKEMVDANVALAGEGGKLRDRFYNRVMFPIRDAQGECIAFGGRIVGTGQPKYLNSNETPLFRKSQVLYGLDKAKAAMAATGIAIVVEGYTDVIALHNAGVGNVVATLGTALTMQHIRILARHAPSRIVYLFDGDAAGQKAADRALAFIDDTMTPEAGKAKIDLAAATLPDNLDPADFVAQRGADALREVIDGAQPLIQYGIERRLAAHDLSRPEGRTAALADALSVLAPIKNSLLAKDYAVQIASRTRLREEDVLAQLASLPVRRPARDDDGAQPHHAGGPGAGAHADGVDSPAAAGAGSPRTHAAAGASHADAPGVSPEGTAAGFGGVRLSQAEVNRRRMERELLCVAAQHPAEALAVADVIAGARWHDDTNRALAESIIATLAENPAAQAAQVITEAGRAVANAAGILTGSVRAEGVSPASLIAFLAEEVALGDMEDAVASLKAQLAAAHTMSSEEYELVFESVVALQKDLVARRAAHKAIG